MADKIKVLRVDTSRYANCGRADESSLYVWLEFEEELIILDDCELDPDRAERLCTALRELLNPEYTND